MKKYESILKRVEQVEYKLGVSYAKTDGKLYKTMWIIDLLGVIYLCLVNILLILSTVLNASAGNKGFFSNQTLVLIAVSTVLEIVSIIFSKKNLKIIGGILGLIPVPYLIYVFYKACYSFGQGLFNLKTIFYTRHLPSIVLITVALCIMLFVALRQRIRVDRSYKRILSNLYENYKNEHKGETLDVSDEEWEEFIKTYTPRNF